MKWNDDPYYFASPLDRPDWELAEIVLYPDSWDDTDVQEALEILADRAGLSDEWAEADNDDARYDIVCKIQETLDIDLGYA